jgi:hypothetical protein
MKNNAILRAGKTKPTIGTKIEGKNAAAIFLSKKFLINSYQFTKSMLLIVHEKGWNKTRI